MKNKGVIIQASARSEGDTHTIIEYIRSIKAFDVINLKEKNIGHFDYDFNNNTDDFIPLMQEIIKTYDLIIFATPVYWYTMSGRLKVFFDRISDLLKTHKELGRALRGKKMAIISVSNHNDLKVGFSMPFEESAKYLGMHYLGAIHTWIENQHITESVKEKISTFLSKLENES